MTSTVDQPPATDPPGLREQDRARRLARQEASIDDMARWQRRHRGHYAELARLFRLHVPARARVLEVGCGLGDLLAAMDPETGVGVDLSPRLIEVARARHPHLRFEAQDPESFDLGETFDFIILGNALADLNDIQSCLACVRRHCHPDTRLVMSSHNALWGPILRTASALGLRRRTGEQNWLALDDFDNLLRLTEFDIIRRASETLLPLRIPVVATVLNRFVAKFWPCKHLCLTQMVIARPDVPPPGASELSCTILIPTKDERGNIAPALARVPMMGSHTEIIFVDGNSADGTEEEIRRQMALHPHLDIRFLAQGDGIGKGDAVRKGFAAATGDVLMILDADLTVPPEDLPRFFEAIVAGRGEFINGTRLVYPMEKQAMRFLNKCGNKFFSMVFTWLIGQRFRDTLCGTKVLRKTHYDVIASNRHYFGDFDPFGDFDLLFGAAKANLKIIEIPVRYRARTYGDTSISRFRHGFLLLRMSALAFRKLKLR
ncbi:MAG: glycosyltransferase [Phycisphaerales bacterium]|nr:glycosyltransferase [Phycisphaerales bacterium]